MLQNWIQNKTKNSQIKAESVCDSLRHELVLRESVGIIHSQPRENQLWANGLG